MSPLISSRHLVVYWRKITYSGNCDRLLKGASKVTLVHEKLAGKPCAHVTIFRKEDDLDMEHHVWIDALKHLLRYSRKAIVRGEDSELLFTYNIVQPPTTREEMFSYRPPSEDK